MPPTDRECRSNLTLPDKKKKKCVCISTSHTQAVPSQYSQHSAPMRQTHIQITVHIIVKSPSFIASPYYNKIQFSYMLGFVRRRTIQYATGYICDWKTWGRKLAHYESQVHSPHCVCMFIYMYIDNVDGVKLLVSHLFHPSRRVGIFRNCCVSIYHIRSI